VESFSFGDIMITDAPESTGPALFDGEAEEQESGVAAPATDAPVADAPLADAPLADAPVSDGPASDGRTSDDADRIESDGDADIDVPSFLAGFGASASTMTPPPAQEQEPEREYESFGESFEEPFEPWSVADNASSAAPADHVPLTNFFAEAAAAVGAKHPSETEEAEEALEALVVDDEPDAESPAPVASDNKSAFTAMLHATNTSSPAPESHGEETLVEPDSPQPEPVQAFVQGGTATETQPVSVARDSAYVATAIQDDLLPQLPRRGRRRGGDHTAPAVPAEVLRIAAAQPQSETVADEPVAAVVVAEPVQESAGAPPLPRRELDAEPVAPPPRSEPAPAPATTESPRPNYELFAAFRAATDQGRADAVRRGDGGGA
jgi:hypothetical protein